MASDPILVLAFLRGGMDGLHLLGPVGDPLYARLRPAELRVPGDAIALAGGPAGADFRLHSKAKALAPLYAKGQLAFIQGLGLTFPTRSHFQAQEIIERGMAAPGATDAGWAARVFGPLGLGGLAPLAAITTNLPVAWSGPVQPAVMPSLADARIWFVDGPDHPLLARAAAAWRTGPAQGQAAVTKALAMTDFLTRLPRDDRGRLIPPPSRPGVRYPDDESGGRLRSAAQMLKLNMGARVILIDLENWDTHARQNELFPDLIATLADGVAAFWADIGPELQARTTVIAMSEFGRRVRANDSGGTDHGHGGLGFALGAGVAGGRIIGPWAGLDPGGLFEGEDLAVGVDYRAVIGEYLERRWGLSPARAFPGYAAHELDLFTA
jgi:uncharacterized protein (DUF1501 family)